MAQPNQETHYGSSPIKKLIKDVAEHDRGEISRIIYNAWKKPLSKEMLDRFGLSDSFLCDEEIKTKYPNLLTKQSIEETGEIVPNKNPSVYCMLLNGISEQVWETLGKPRNIITFLDCPKSNALCGHPTTTECCPDFIAIAHLPNQPPSSGRWHWSALEATGEIQSSGTNQPNAHAQAGAYTTYLLQSRPDLISVLGIFVDVGYFKLFITNALGSFSTEKLKWTTLTSSHLLYAWVSYLYQPRVDSSIERLNSPDNPIFNVTVVVDKKSKIYNGLSIYKAGRAFGRRTLVLKPEGMPGKGQVNIAIKEQYIEPTRRFTEGPMLQKVHDSKRFPGVVRMSSYGVVQSNGSNLDLKDGSFVREKTRLVMEDTAEPLMDAETVWTALIAFYDLLEVTRFLYTKRKVLHRDISEGNVLLREEPPPDPAFSGDLQDMCFASYLLQQDDSTPKEKRLETRVLLIDFDMSEDSDISEGKIPGKEPVDRTGTPLFMARAVRSGKYLKGTHTFPPMPELAKEAARYRDCVGERLKDFPMNDEVLLKVVKNTSLPRFKHKLRYDAESVFWLLLYWCLLAKPDQDPNPQDIGSEAWSIFNTVKEGVDYRDAHFIRVFVFPEGLCHPAYAPLNGLLEDMAAQLQGDLGLINENPELTLPHEHKEDPARGKDEYLHEAFQRLILNFLFEHRDAPFMKEKKSKDYRKVERGGVYRQSLSTHDKEVRADSQTKRKRDDTSSNTSGGAPDNTPDEANEDPDDRGPIKKARAT